MDTLERDKEICQARNSGETFTAIAHRFGLSRQRAHQIFVAADREPRIRARGYKQGVDRQPKHYSCTRCGALFIKSGGRQKRCDGCRLLCHPSGALRVVPQSKCCAACGTVFVSKQARRKTCSSSCWHFLYRPYLPRAPRPPCESTCLACGRTFYITTGFRHKHCSPEHRPSYHAPMPRAMAKSEVIFSEKHPTLIRLNPNCRLFKLAGYSYTPDFRNAEGTVFYEVIGTRQAFHANKHKYIAFRSAYPSLTLKIVKPDGTNIKLKEADHDPH